MNLTYPSIRPLLEAISVLLHKKVEQADAAVPSADAVVVGQMPGAGRLALRSADGSPFSEDEKGFLREMIALVLSGRHLQATTHSLDERVRILERENVDLSLRNRALAESSSKDALTGLYTRWYVMEKIEEELNRALRTGSPLSLLMVDIDHFKRVNDSFGHPVGDQVLQVVGQLLRDSCRIYDIPGRYGGEEFCLMLPETEIGSTGVVAERIRRRVESTAVESEKGPTIRVTASIGMAGFNSNSDQAILGANALIERADQALYRAKDRGRNRVETWDLAPPSDH